MGSLPTGLAGAHAALHNHGDDHLLRGRLTSLVWLRLLTDPLAPMIGGNDPRAILDPPLAWADFVTLATDTPWALPLLTERLNVVMGEDILAHWDDVPREAGARALREIGRWAIPAGDPLGVASQLTVSRSSQQARGAFYTPYEVSLMMAQMLDPFPGASVCDPCCGSGGMLLAALEAVRSKHGMDATLELYGVDIDPMAVRLCKMNLALAGIAPNAPGRRVWEKDTLAEAPAAVKDAVAQHEAGQLPLFGATA